MCELDGGTAAVSMLGDATSSLGCKTRPEVGSVDPGRGNSEESVLCIWKEDLGPALGKPVLCHCHTGCWVL